MQELRRRMASAKAWGIEPCRSSRPAEVKELVPFIDESVILGGFYTPSVGVVDSLRAGTIMRERAQEAGALTVSAEHRGARHRRRARPRPPACAPTRGDIEAETVVIACGVLEPADRPDGRRVDPADAGGPPDDRRRPGAALRRRQGRRSSSRSSATWTRTCTSARTATGLEIGSYAHRPILHDPEEIPSIEEAALVADRVPVHAGRLRAAAGAGARADARDRRRRDGRREVRDQRPALADARRRCRCSARRPRSKGLWSAAAVWVKEGPGVGKPVAEWMVARRVRDRPPRRPTSRASTSTRRPRDARAGARGRGLQQDLRDRPPRRAVGVEPRRAAVAVLRARARARRRVLRGRRLGAAALVRVERAAARGVRRPRHAAARPSGTSRWWSPIINAEHLAMRDRAGMVDLTAFAIFDVAGPGALDAVQRVADAPDGRRARPGRLHAACSTPSGGFKSDLTIMRLGDEHVPRRHRRRARHGRPASGSPTTCPPTARRRSPTSPRPGRTLGLWGPRARDILAVVTARRRLARGLPVRHLPDDRDRHAARARLAHLLRRRPRLGALRADRAGRAAVGHRLGGRPRRTGSSRSGSASTARPAGSRSATAPTASSSTSEYNVVEAGMAWGKVKDAGLRRQGGARRATARRSRPRSCAR